MSEDRQNNDHDTGGHDDYGFGPHDFAGIGDPTHDEVDMLGMPPSSMAGVDVASSQAAPDAAKASDDTVDANDKRSASKTGLMIAGAATLMLGLVGGVGYLGWNMLKPSASSSQVAGLGGQGGQGGQGAENVVPVPPQLVPGNSALNTANEIANSLGGFDDQGKTKAAPLLIEHSLAGGDDGVASPHSQEPAAMAGGPSVAEEDAMYDNLLSQAETINAPPGAIKIDPRVVSQVLESKRLERLEGDVKTARQEMDSVKQVVTAMQSQVAEISAAVNASQANNEKLIGTIEALSKEVEAASKRQEGEVAALRKQVAAVSDKASKAAEAARSSAAQVPRTENVAKASPPAPAPASTVRAAVPQPKPAQVAASAPVTLPPPVEVRQVTAPVVQAKVDLPPQCDGRYTSSNWRVKGINASAAYVVRVQDGEGLMVRAGMSIPGFGEVVAFDRNSRTVCTTQGLVKR